MKAICVNIISGVVVANDVLRLWAENGIGREISILRRIVMNYSLRGKVDLFLAKAEINAIRNFSPTKAGSISDIRTTDEGAPHSHTVAKRETNITCMTKTTVSIICRGAIVNSFLINNIEICRIVSVLAIDGVNIRVRIMAID